MTKLVETISVSRAKLIQQKLETLGYPLPKYGADGFITESGETWKAIEDFAFDHGFDLGKDGEAGLQPGSEFGLAIDMIDSCPLPKVSMDGITAVNLTNNHPQRYSKGVRQWKDIDAIVLHQTAYLFDSREQWYTLRAHVGISDALAEFYIVNPLNCLMWHANGFNRRSIGIEVSGSFPGLSGDNRTHWKPQSGYSMHRHGPHVFTPLQAAATKAAIKFIMEEAERHGGRIKFCFAHRQASKDRIGDPGEDVWREVGTWAVKEMALNDGGRGYKIGSGYALPDSWTGEARGIGYFNRG